MTLEFFSATDVGRARDNNEDSVALDGDAGLAVLADGDDGAAHDRIEQQGGVAGHGCVDGDVRGGQLLVPVVGRCALSGKGARCGRSQTREHQYDDNDESDNRNNDSDDNDDSRQQQKESGSSKVAQSRKPGADTGYETTQWDIRWTPYIIDVQLLEHRRGVDGLS